MNPAPNPFASVLFHVGPVAITDTVVVSGALSLALVVGLRAAMMFDRSRQALEIVYEIVEGAVTSVSRADVTPLVPLILTLWIFIGAANLVGIVPEVASPTRDLSLVAALAAISFVSGHVYAFRMRGFAYLREYIEPSPLLLPFNIIGEITRTIALALRLFGNMLSGHLIAAIFVLVAGPLLPVPILLLGLLTGVVQAYIFGVLTLVFATSSVEIATRDRSPTKGTST